MSDARQRKWLFYLNDETLWSIIRDDVPERLPLLQALKSEAQA